MAIGSPQWMYASGEAYEIDQSLRFKDTAKNGTGSYLTKTPTSAGNSDLWTYSCWAKGLPAPNANSHQTQILLGVDGDDSNDYYLWLSISNDGTFDFRQISASGYDFRKISTALYRDPSSWYHFVVAYDSANGTAEDRIKMYVNGERITSFGTNANPSSGQDAFVNKTKIHTIGRFAYNGEVQGGALNGYLAEVNLIDGQALTPADFGETGTYGEWKPIEYSGTYGTNGFYLNFAGGGIMSATGGNSTATDGDYKAASFTSNGTFTPSADGYVEYLVIGGGGGAGSGGGGAGGYRTGYLPVTASTAYSITVGSGGTSHTTSSNGGAGANSIFSSITSIGGGYGAGADPAPGGVGGSGGGGGGGNSSVVGGGQNNPGGAATSGQGNAGGYGYTDASSYGIGGGGGGAGSAGSNASSGGPAGNGGNGLASSITGSSVTYAGGGGGGGAIGGGTKNGGSGGTGGGGAGGNGSATGTAGTTNTGGGGGGGGASSSGGAGGSGIVIIRYKFQ